MSPLEPSPNLVSSRRIDADSDRAIAVRPKHPRSMHPVPSKRRRVRMMIPVHRSYGDHSAGEREVRKGIEFAASNGRNHRAPLQAPCKQSAVVRVSQSLACMPVEAGSVFALPTRSLLTVRAFAEEIVGLTTSGRTAGRPYNASPNTWPPLRGGSLSRSWLAQPGHSHANRAFARDERSFHALAIGWHPCGAPYRIRTPCASRREAAAGENR
jgi:hypothetical protein